MIIEFITKAIEAIENKDARRIDGDIIVNNKTYQYKAYSISGNNPLIRIDLTTKNK